MKNFIFISYFLIVSLTVFSQKTFIYVEGYIFDDITGEPLENVNISLKDSKLGTITDGFGKFKINTRKLPVTLIISHVSYETKYIVVRFEPLKELDIRLKPRTEELKGVVITSEKIDILYKDDKYSVLDYELLDDGIILLIYKYKLTRAELLFIEFTGKELFGLKLLPGKPLKLFKDCLGNIHIITKTKAFQVYSEGNSIKLYNGVDLDYFKGIMGYCKFIIGSKMYYKSYGFMDLVVSFYYIDTVDKKNFLFRTIADQQKLDFLKYNPENYSLLSGAGGLDLGDLRGLPGDSAILKEIWKMEIKKGFNPMAYFSPVYVPMFKLGDTVCVFNHPESKIELFDERDSLFKETPISYHETEKKDMVNTLVSAFQRQNKWLKKIYVDPVQKKAYTLFFNNNGTKELKEIDMETGELVSIMRIPFPYVEKISVHNGYVYFIYKGWGEYQKKKLFRQLIR
ncbi:MAG: carboxypeptidase-like regulatory domain-containing protein [Bacteroidales bacterium]|nr:carboxypeptidase-like regulatory domain-containing protein [Bacteroidales bacterium]